LQFINGLRGGLFDCEERLLDIVREDLSALRCADKGAGFIDYATFSKGYEELKAATKDFRDLSPEPIISLVQRVPISFIVLRAILGFSPPEWAYITTQRSGVEVRQGHARTLDRAIRMAPLTPLRLSTGENQARLRAMISTASKLLTEPPPQVPSDKVYRLDKADTKNGLDSLQPLADLGVPYAMLLYERFLGRPFAGHRDSVSELVGDGRLLKAGAALSFSIGSGLLRSPNFPPMLFSAIPHKLRIVKSPSD
jgi:hypothetical protein